MIEIPGVFAHSTVEREGERGAAWLAELPQIVDQLLQRWGCTPDGPVRHGGVAVIVPVRTRALGPAVLKVSFPHPGNVHEPDAFAAWDGRAAVRLYERDDEHFAMLLERARMTTLADLEDGDEAAKIAGTISRRLAITVPPGLPRLSDQAGDWDEQLRKDAAELTHPLSRRAVNAAIATSCELGRIQPELMVHGDFHATNILRADREPWLVVDPKGFAGDPAYDAGMPIKWRSLRSLMGDELRKAVRRGLHIFAETAELDRERVPAGLSSTRSRVRSGVAGTASAWRATDRTVMPSRSSPSGSPRSSPTDRACERVRKRRRFFSTLSEEVA